MKSIVLHTARPDNGGTRRAAGEEVGVGDKPDQISLAKATDLVSRHLGSGKGYKATSSRVRKRTPSKKSAPAAAAAAPAKADDAGQ